MNRRKADGFIGLMTTEREGGALRAPGFWQCPKKLGESARGAWFAVEIADAALVAAAEGGHQQGGILRAKIPQCFSKIFPDVGWGNIEGPR
ncbi:hypothetical protein [Bradyrhizobium sp. USDA 10063]